MTCSGHSSRSSGMACRQRIDLERLDRDRSYLRCDRALREFWLGDVGDPLEVVVAGVAEVSGAETEEDGHRAAVPALVLQVVSPVLGTHLGLAHVAAAPADQLLRVVGVGGPGLQVTPGLASEVSLAALEADVVGVSVHGEPCRY